VSFIETVRNQWGDVVGYIDARTSSGDPGVPLPPQPRQLLPKDLEKIARKLTPAEAKTAVSDAIKAKVRILPQPFATNVALSDQFLFGRTRLAPLDETGYVTGQ